MRHSDQNYVHCAFFFEAASKLNEEECGDRTPSDAYHPINR